LANSYQNQISEFVKKEWGYDQSIELSNSNELMYNVLVETCSDAINYDDVMIRSFVDGVFTEIDKAVPEHVIRKGDDDYYNHIEHMLSLKLSYVTKDAKWAIAHSIKDDSLRSKYENTINNLELFNSGIINGYYFILESGFGFNFEIVKFEVQHISDEQVSKLVDKYKRSDGQYTYEGAFLSREAIEKHLKARYCVMKFVFRFAINAEENSIIRIKFKD
jgi:hypothetical protein